MNSWNKLVKVILVPALVLAAERMLMREIMRRVRR